MLKKRKKKKQENEERTVTFQQGVSALLYHFKNLRSWKPNLFYIGIFRVVPDILIPLFSILLPTLIVKGLEEKWEMKQYIGLIGCLMVAMLVVNMIFSRLQTILSEEKDGYRLRYLSMLCNKKMEVDYEILESKEFQDKQGVAFFWIAEWTNGPMERCISSPGAILACVVGMIVYGVILAKQSLWILLFIVISVLISVKMSAHALKGEDIMWHNTSPIRRKMRYIHNRTMDFASGKDIRLYGMQRWLSMMNRRLLKENEKHLSFAQWRYCFESMTDSFMMFIRDGAAYIYLIFQIVYGDMTVSDFVLYTSLVTGFSTWFRKGVEEVQWCVRGGYAFHAIRECFGIENAWTGEQKAEGTKEVTIEFQNVSFTYPGAKEPTLQDLNLKIQKGEKLALVGINGAGKTTFVKLLCGFYPPTRGIILVNGISIQEYDREEYYSMIAAVFQDAQMLPVSIGENISCRKIENSREDKIKKCIKMAGLEGKVEKLSEGSRTLLVRELSSKAIDLSGGEKQKLLLSRALYKEAPFLILDEPTAALDPIAENDIYLKYSELTVGKTSIFISHRLSSTRFCDKIILISGGRILEEGTHEELLELKGEYSNMYEIQSRYYKEEIDKKEEGELVYV